MEEQPPTQKTGHDFHAQSETDREIEHDFPSALKNISEAIVMYNQEGNIGGMAEAFASQAITYKHLGRQAKDKKLGELYFVAAKGSAMTGVQIAEQSGNPQDVTLPLYETAKMLEELGDKEKALQYYERAVASPLPESHNRPAVTADMQNHLAACGYSLAKTKEEKLKYLKQAEDSIQSITQSGEDKLSEDNKYNYNVWLSGAYMRTAKAIYKDDPTKAETYLQIASEIIKNDERLALRTEELARLRQELEQNEVAA